jgi:hypothetical protein
LEIHVMAKGEPLSNYQRKIVDRYYEHLDTITMTKLAEAVSELYLSENSKKVENLWRTVQQALAKTPVDEARAQRIVAQKNVAELAQVVDELSKLKPGQVAVTKPRPEAAPATANTPTPAPAAGVAPAPAPAPGSENDPLAPHNIKRAYDAFKKRIKLARLDEESRLGRNPLSTGGKSNIVAIQPPREFPRAVWDELVKQGRLKTDGRGFYSLP